jgi:hypothetical protein
MSWMSEPIKNKSARPIRGFIIKVALACIFVGFIALVVTPNFTREPCTSPANACINNLRQIDGAKQQWALENGKINGDTVVTENDIKPYLRLDAKGNLPRCPSGGKYVIGKLDEPPTCSLGTNVTPPHVLR